MTSASGFVTTSAACWLALSSTLGGCERTRSLEDGPSGFIVTIQGQDDPAVVGTPDEPLPFTLTGTTFTVDIAAVGGNYSGGVSLEVQPYGRIQGQPVGAELSGGVANDVEVTVQRSFSEVRILATDLGYLQGSALGGACNDERDNDGDDIEDLLDAGCFAGDDKNEKVGTAITGASVPLFFETPRIEDIQRPISLESDDASPLLGERVFVDHGPLYITQRTVDGFYVSDVSGFTTDGGPPTISVVDNPYTGVFAFSFSTPEAEPLSGKESFTGKVPLLEQGQCLAWVTGSVGEFFGFTEVSTPLWEVEDCPWGTQSLQVEPVDITSAMVRERDLMEPFEGSLVRVRNVLVAERYEECDSNGDGKVDYLNDTERNCAQSDCGNDPNCTILEFLITRDQWSVQLQDEDCSMADRACDGSNNCCGEEVNIITVEARPDFDPRDHEGVVVDEIVGTLRHLNFGRPAWMITPRDEQDFPL